MSARDKGRKPPRPPAGTAASGPAPADVERRAGEFWSSVGHDTGRPSLPIGGPLVRRLVRERPVLLSERVRRAIDIAVLAGVALLLLVFFRPGLLLTVTTATGGDTGAHIYAPWYLKHHLLPTGTVSGWSPDWYAGFPILHFYFPVVAVFQALVSYLIPYEIAFKLGTIVGIFFLPPAVYLFLRLLRFRFPIPIIGAVFAVGFLFMDSFSIYGGNIASSLSGEYSFALSLALCLVFVGLAYRLAVEPHGRPLLTSAILALAALSHLVPVIMVALFVPVLLFWSVRTHGLSATVQRFGIVFGLAFALTAFWSIPFLIRLEYSTNMHWNQLEGWSTILPRELWPYLAGTTVAAVLGVLRRDRRLLVLFVPPAVAVAIYFLLPPGHVYNGRFIPFFYLGAVLCSAYAVGTLIPTIATSAWNRRAGRVAAISVTIVAATIGASVLASKGPSYVDNWIEHNYGGYESQPAFPAFKALSDRIAALPPGRVMWEPSPSLSKFGTPLALMTLPYWAGQPSMEGLYFESSITTPFHFLTVAELADRPSNPIAGLPYSTFDLRRGTTHMKLFDVSYYVTSSTRAREAARKTPGLDHIADVDEFSVFAVDSPGQVVVPKYQPVVLTGGDWIETNVKWFSRSEDLEVPLVRDGPASWRRVPSVGEALPATPLQHGGRSIDANVGDDEISFQTDAIGEPHWIKTSYFPNWRVEGAEGPFLASPSLMMVIPTQSRVRLHYERTWVEWTGLVLTLAALGALALRRSRRLLVRHGGA